jgi:Sec-independent protein translocase protein TatA
MFDLDLGKMVLVGGVALVVIGPKDLPAALRFAGRVVAQVRRVRGDIRRAADTLMADASLDREIAAINDAARISLARNPATAMRGSLTAEPTVYDAATHYALAYFAACPARATSEGIELGDVPRYPSEADARAACGDDPVVWADSRSGFFYPKFHSDYGKTPQGAYTCYSRAKKADYWSLTPEGEGGREGREFPLFFCNSCS